MNSATGNEAAALHWNTWIGINIICRNIGCDCILLNLSIVSLSLYLKERSITRWKYPWIHDLTQNNVGNDSNFQIFQTLRKCKTLWFQLGTKARSSFFYNELIVLLMIRMTKPIELLVYTSHGTVKRQYTSIGLFPNNGPGGCPLKGAPVKAL